MSPGVPPPDGDGASAVSQPVLEARGVTKRYGETRALKGVSLQVPEGECVALVGESGSGKTTLLRSFNRMVDPDEGVLLRQGRPLTELDPIRLRRETGYVQQEGGLLPHWTVSENASLVPNLLGFADAEARGSEALRMLGLAPERFGRRYPGQLSGGERQRAALARAVAARPSILLMDEPFGALDAITRSEVRRAFATLRAELGPTAVLVTHDLHEAFELADRIVVLFRGRVEFEGTPEELSRAPDSQYAARLLARAGLGT